MAKCIIILALTTFLCPQLSAQEGSTQRSETLLTDPIVAVSEITNLTPDDYIKMELPPLQQLLENARQNPAVAYYDTRRQEEESTLKSERRSWLKLFKLSGNYQYGLTNNYSTYSDAGTSLFDSYSGRAQNWYSVGATVSIPLDEIFDRGNRIKRQKLKVLESKYEIERWHDEQSLRIIDVYTAAMEALATLKSRAEAATIATAQYKSTEANFIHGKADVQELSRQKNIESSAVWSYEQTRSSLNNSLLKLEVLSRTKIIKK